MWQQRTADGDGDGSISDTDNVSWREALVLCAELELGGHADWRLPNSRELHSIVDYDRVYASVAPKFEAESLWYWSSSAVAKERNQAWATKFSAGHTLRTDKSVGMFVRAARTLGPR